MNTPITDAIWDQTKGIPEYHAKLEDTSKRLETDRAALMGALKAVLKYSTPTASARIDATRILATARANFPES